jgi:hypothetical protein
MEPTAWMILVLMLINWFLTDFLLRRIERLTQERDEYRRRCESNDTGAGSAGGGT